MGHAFDGRYRPEYPADHGDHPDLRLGVPYGQTPAWLRPDLETLPMRKA